MIKRIIKNKKIQKFLIKFLAFGSVIFVVYLGILYTKIVSKFEFHRWNLPSRVYSDSFSLYPGLHLSLNQLINKLEHLEYRKVSTYPLNPGQFVALENSVEVFLHDFNYPSEKFEGFILKIQIQLNQVLELMDVTKQTKIEIAYLEPEIIGSIFDSQMEDRTLIKINDIPSYLPEAVISIEDERFYNHSGIDPKGIFRAFVKNILAGRVVEGGSTLTQQLIKNLYLHSRKTFLRKFNELFMALLLDAKYSKEEIMEAYLNEIYLGQRGPASISGIEAASQFYFSKKAKQLTKAQAATIAGMIRSPGHYSPIKNPKRAIERRNFVLNRMLEREIISKTDYQNAIKEPLPLKTSGSQDVIAPHFIDFVQINLNEKFPKDKLESEGLGIFTTLDMDQQRAAYESVNKWIKEFEKRSLIKKNKDADKLLETAFISVQPGTGFIRSYIGGRDYQKNQFDHIWQAKRQPGSAFKPFVYLTALNPKTTNPPFTLASRLQDKPIKFENGWSPQNYDKKFHGEVSMRRALENSYNVATVWLAQQVGFDNVIDTARKAGITNDLEAYPSLALGAFELSPLELMTAYTIFPNFGVKTNPIAIRQVVTPEGEVLEKKDFQMEKSFSDDVIYIANQLLRGVLDYGTAKSARARGFTHIAAGKTGTTSDYRDAWFVGFTPDLLALSWVGYDDATTTGLSGSSSALPIWTDFMKKAQTFSSKAFSPGENVIIVPIDNETGLKFHRSCSEKIEEYFIEGTEPEVSCKKRRRR